MRMISQSTGRRLLCCWEDCERLGDTRWQVVVHESDARNLVYLFCGEGDKTLYLNSVTDLRNLPSGSKSLGRFTQGVALPAKK